MTGYVLPPSSVTLANGSNSSPNITMTLEFVVASACELADIWWYSPAGAGGLPDQCCLFLVSTEAEVSGTLDTSPSWSGAAASGWVGCSYPGVALAAGTYLAAVHVPPAAADGYGKTVGFWSSGAGSSGFTAGPVSAPNYAASTLQGAVQSGNNNVSYPTVTESGNYFGVGVGVTVAGASPAGLLMAGIV